MKKVHAIYENGVFRPTEQVELPEHSVVEFEPRVVVGEDETANGMAEIYEVMSRRFESGQSDVAERHNDHQP